MAALLESIVATWKWEKDGIRKKIDRTLQWLVDVYLLSTFASPD